MANVTWMRKGTGNLAQNTVLQRAYPEAIVIGIEQLYVPHVGWYDVLVDNAYDAFALIHAGVDGAGRTIEMFALRLDEHGVRRIADFRRSEILVEDK